MPTLPALRLPVGGALLALAIVRILASVRAACTQLACDDFGRFWYATVNWSSGRASLYAPTPASMSGDGLLTANLNLPHTHILFLPYTALPLEAAAWAWLATGALSAAASLAIVARETGWRPGLGWLVVFLWWMPTHLQLVTGQVVLVLLLPVTLAWAAVRRDRWNDGGVWLGVAVAIKPFLAPLIAWLLWRRKFAAAGAAVAVVLAVTVGGVLLFGPSEYRAWREAVQSVSWYGRSFNASVWGEVFRLFDVSTQFAPLAVLGHAAVVAVAASAVIAVGTWGICRRTDDVDAQWSVVMCATLLVSPLGWVYYGLLLLPGWRARWPGAAATACWLIPTPWLLLGQPSRVATLLWGSAATWGLVLASVHTWRQAVRAS